MTKTVTRRTASKTSQLEKFRQFLGIQAEKAELTKRENILKTDLGNFADEHGVRDEEKGHRVVTFPESISTVKGLFRGFMRQRRVTSVFQEDVAEKLLRRKGLYEECLSTYLDTEKIDRLYAQDKITAKEYDSLTKENVTWAFVPIKD